MLMQFVMLLVPFHILYQTTTTYIDKYRAMHSTFPGKARWMFAYDRAGLTGSGCGALGWGLLCQFSPFRYFPHFPLLSKQTLAIEYHVYIWQVSPQLSCSNTYQIWMWFRESNRFFCKIVIVAYGEISEWSLSNPHPRAVIQSGI